MSATVAGAGMAQEALITLNGILTLERVPLAVTPAAIFVQLLDVTRADAPATIVSETRFATDEAAWSSGTVPYQLEVPDTLPADRRYALRAHVSLAGSRAVQHGDYVTTESFPFSHADGNVACALFMRLV